MAHIVNTLGAKTLCCDKQSAGKEWYIYRSRDLIKYPEVSFKQCKVYMCISICEMLYRVSSVVLFTASMCVCVHASVCVNNGKVLKF